MTLFPSDTSYVQDILHQPEALKDTLRAFSTWDINPLRKLGKRLRDRDLDGVVLTGMGSSFHALHPLFLALVRAGVHAQSIETSELIHHASGLLSRDRLVVAVSQSGRSAEILALLEQVSGCVPLLAVTNSSDSPLAAGSDALLVTRAGGEFSVSCKTYVTSLVALELLGKLLTGEDPGALLSEMESLPESVGSYLSRLDPYVRTFQKLLEGVHTFLLVGRGPSLAAVWTGGLIIKEAAHFPAEGLSAAAFRHGPMELISLETFVLVYEGLEPTKRLNRDLAADIEKAGGRCVLVTSDEVEGLFHLPHAPADLLPVLEILPAQMASLALARRRGHIPGMFSQVTKVTAVE